VKSPSPWWPPTLSLVVIFVPLAFMKGRTGLFFSSYGWTVAFADPRLAVRELHPHADAGVALPEAHRPILSPRERKAHGGPHALAGAEIRLTSSRWSLGHRALVMAGLRRLRGLAVLAAFRQAGSPSSRSTIPASLRFPSRRPRAPTLEADAGDLRPKSKTS
jgi:hypothetical protein